VQDQSLTSAEEPGTPGAAEAITDKKLSITHRSPEDWRFDREALYSNE